MADIICRVCGNEWDSTGGLHYSHSDLTWWQYDQLVHGVGCPCCQGVRSEHLDDNEITHLEERWLDTVHYLSEGTLHELEAREAPLWCFTGAWDDDGEPNPRVIPLFFTPPNWEETDFPGRTWKWVGTKPEPTEKRPASSPAYAYELQRKARLWVQSCPDLPAGCLYLQHEDTRARDYGLGIPHAPYVDNYFAGVALVPRYRDENDPPAWHECCVSDSHRDKAMELDVKEASELAFLGDDEDPGLYVQVAGRWIDNDEDADFVSRANYEAVEGTLKGHAIDILYDGPDIWACVGEWEYHNSRARLNHNAINTIYEIHGALEDYPCLDDELASRLEHEDQMEEVEEWIESHGTEIEERLGIHAKLYGPAIDDRCRGLFYHESGEFDPNPEVDDICAALLDLVPTPRGWNIVRTINEAALFIYPGAIGYDSSSDTFTGYVIEPDRESEPIRAVDGLPRNQILDNRFGGVKSVDWETLGDDFKLGVLDALVDE